MTNQQAPEIYALHTVPNEGKKPWFGIYAVRADAEHDAKVMRDVTGRDWSVVRLVVADTNDRVPEAWTNLLAYVLQDELHNRLTPRVIDIAYTAFMQAKRPNNEDGSASDWFNDTRPVVRELIAKLRKDLIKELAGAPQPVPSATVALSDDLRAHVGVEQAKRQYYYKVDGCPAKNSDSPDCICWHDEGTGPYAINDSSLMWRDAARAPANSVTAPAATPSAASIAWNALRDLTDPLGEAGVKIMGHVRVFAQRQYEAGLAEGSAARKKGGT